MPQYVIVLGGANIDMFGFSNEKIISNNSNPGKVVSTIGGVSKNICENLARLNIDTKFITAFGNDYHKDIITNYLNQIGVDISHSIYSNKYPSSTYLAIIDNNKDLNVAISDMDVLKEITTHYLESKQSLFENAEYIVIDANNNIKILDYMINKYKHKKIICDTVSVNKGIKFKKYLNLIHTLKLNKIEAETMTKMNLENKDDFTKAINLLLSKGLKQVIITNGPSDIYYNDKDMIKSFKVKTVKVKNTTGAGDAFTSGIIYGYIKNYNIDKCIKLASKLASLTVGVIETNYKELNERNLLEDENE